LRIFSFFFLCNPTPYLKEVEKMKQNNKTTTKQKASKTTQTQK